MALLHKTQKQLLPSILFVSTLNATLAKKGQSILSTRQNIFSSPIQSFKKSQRGKKKEIFCVTQNIAFNQTTFVWREDFAFIQFIFFFSEFGGVLLWFLLLHQNNCFETKGFLSPICNQQMTNFGKGKKNWGRKKLIYFKVQRRNLFWTLAILLIKHKKLLDNGTTAHFPFRVGCIQFFHRSIFFLSR